jgi:hypothetical protein
MAVSDRAGDEASQLAHRAARSKNLERTARLGFLSRGFVYAFVGVVALRIAVGGRGGEADQKGAFQSLADSAWGIALLWLIALGFLGYAAWRATEAAVGHRSEHDERKRTFQRVVSGVKVVLYLALAATAASFARGGTGGKEGDSWSARVMTMTGGRLLVGAVGLAIAGAGVYMVVKAVKDDYAEGLQTGRMGPTFRRVALALGKAGYGARGVAFTVLGALVLLAAVSYDPQKAEGLDVALKTLARAPFGSALLAVVGLGLVAFGAYSFVEARYRRIDTS